MSVLNKVRTFLLALMIVNVYGYFSRPEFASQYFSAGANLSMALIASYMFKSTVKDGREE